MSSASTLQRLEAEFSIPPSYLRATVGLLDGGATPHFIARYRRDETGDLDEERAIAIQERLHVLREIEARKEAILEQAGRQGGDVEAWRTKLLDCYDQDLVDDIYQLFRPKRASEASRADEKGLSPLAMAIHHRTLGGESPVTAAQAYVSEAKGLPTTESVLEGVAQILAEKYGSDPELRAELRAELSNGVLKAAALAPDRKGAQRYKDYFQFEQPVRRIPANRMLALRHAEREGIVQVRLELPEGRELELFRKRFAADLAPDSPTMMFLDVVFRLAYETRVHRACEDDVRRRLKEKADRETIRNLARNLHSQLLAPGLGPKKAIAVRASNRALWIVLVGEDGSILRHETIALSPETKAPAGNTPGNTAPAGAAPEPTEHGQDRSPTSQIAAATDVAAPPASADEAPVEGAATVEPSPGSPPLDPAAAEAATVEAVAAAASEPESTSAPAAGTPALTREEAIARLVRWIEEERPAGIAIPHGRRQSIADTLVHEAVGRLAKEQPIVVAVDEAMAAIHSSSAAGRHAMPGLDGGLRTAVSMGRRMQDPLFELLGMEPRVLLSGHAAAVNEVHQGQLARQIDSLISSCLARVGVDLNRAGEDLLARVPGIGKELARAIVKHRSQVGGFQSLAQLQQVPGLDANTQRNIAGFLRVHGGSEPLDGTGVHPEHHELVARIAQHLGVTVAQLLGRNLRHVDPQPLVDDQHGRLRILDVLYELAHAGKDPRGPLTVVHNASLRSFDDLRPDLQLQGRVTNLTDFGAFLDLGIGHDGLLHISQILPSRRHDPDRLLVVGEVLSVYVLAIDKDTRRISLTMFRPRHLEEARTATVGERMQAGRQRGRDRRQRGEPSEVHSRAARAPEGRRGPRQNKRGRTPEARPEGGDGGGVAFERGPRGPRHGEPRVFTVESEKPATQSLGHKGELRSLAGLRALLEQGKQAATPPEEKPGG
jgi:transcriptional accessory protein Tex/SPT6